MTYPSDPVFDASNPHVMADDREPAPVPDWEAVAREIIKHISDAALELAFIRHSLTSAEFDREEYPDIASEVQAQEAWWENDIKPDVLDCLTGDETGCAEPEDLNETNCELLWLKGLLARSAYALGCGAEVRCWIPVEVELPPATGEVLVWLIEDEQSPAHMTKMRFESVNMSLDYCQARGISHWHSTAPPSEPKAACETTVDLRGLWCELCGLFQDCAFSGCDALCPNNHIVASFKDAPKVGCGADYRAGIKAAVKECGTLQERFAAITSSEAAAIYRGLGLAASNIRRLLPAPVDENERQ